MNATTKPERFTVGTMTVRATYRRPGGPVYGYIVLTADRKLVAHVHAGGAHPDAYTRDEARRGAVRFAKGRAFVRDHYFSSGPCNDRPPIRRPDWLAFCGRWPVVAKFVRTRDVMSFHPSTGLPEYGRHGERRRPPREPKPTQPTAGYDVLARFATFPVNLA